jgi:hypothetical protein
MQVEEYSKVYESKTDGELLHLKLKLDDLTPEALIALDTELSKRGINDGQLLDGLLQEQHHLGTRGRKIPRFDSNPFSSAWCKTSTFRKSQLHLR